MRLVLGTHALGLGGSETYALTLAEQLCRLGHVVTVVAVGLGDGAALGRARGIEVLGLDEYVPGPCDGVVAQDGGTAFELGGRHPTAPLVFVAHSEEFDEQLPPRLDGLVDAVVVLNERVRRRVAALAVDGLRVVRLRQPIDIARFRPRSPPRGSARKLLLLGNNVDGERLDVTAAAATDAGLELVRIGTKGTSTYRPELAIGEADIVMGYGRCALEGMAGGRATYVYDHLGGDGWVTPESYPQLERDGFGGRATSAVLGRERLLDDLARYDCGMGIANRDLVVGRHRAEHHAHEIVSLFRSLGAVDAQPRALAELGGLVRAHWSATARISELEGELGARVGEIRSLSAALEAERAEHAALRQTLRYRVGAALARPLDRARELRARLGADA